MTEPAAVAPITSTIAGVELVTIPVAHYAELLDCQRRLGETPAPRHMRPGAAQLATDPRSRLFGDPEVASFLYELFGRAKLKDAYSACVEHFGERRTPSRATIARFWGRLRGRA